MHGYHYFFYSGGERDDKHWTCSKSKVTIKLLIESSNLVLSSVIFTLCDDLFPAPGYVPVFQSHVEVSLLSCVVHILLTYLIINEVKEMQFMIRWIVIQLQYLSLLYHNLVIFCNIKTYWSVKASVMPEALLTWGITTLELLMNSIAYTKCDI